MNGLSYQSQVDADNVTEHTGVMNDGDYIAYAEINFGPYTIEYERGRSGVDHFRDKDGEFTIKGPYIGEPTGNEITLPVNVDTVSDINDVLDDYEWDYIERCENEVHEG